MTEAQVTNQIPVDVNAKVARVLRKYPRKVIMNDGTFRVYYPFHFKEEPEAEHFAVGIVEGKTDDEILHEMKRLICSNGMQFYHEDGTPHI